MGNQPGICIPAAKAEKTSPAVKVGGSRRAGSGRDDEGEHMETGAGDVAIAGEADLS